MSNQLSIFSFEDHKVRTLLINDEPWFIAVDVCKALKIANHRDALLKLDDDEKGVGLTDTLGGKQEMLIINESGLFTLTLRCRDAINKGTLPYRFRKWVTGEVLPSIRKTGRYEINTSINHSQPRTIEVSRVNLICLVNHMIWLKEFYFSNDLYNTFKALNSDFGVRMHDHIKDGYCVAWSFKQDLQM